MKNIFKLSFLVVFAFLFTSLVIKKYFFDVTITPPSISGLCVGGGYQILGDIVISENALSDFPQLGTGHFLRLQVTGNFELEAGVGSVLLNGTGDLTNASISVSPTEVIVFYDANNGGTDLDEMTISGLRVRAIVSPGSGSLQMVGGSVIAGVSPITNFATFSSVASPTLTFDNGDDADKIICSGQNVTFTATGASTYAFYINSTLVATNSTGTFSTTALTDGAVVSVVGTNAGCSTTLTGTPYTVNSSPAAFLTSNDSDNTICVGQSITFTAAATGTNYEFYRGLTIVQIGPSNTLTIPNATLGDAGSYVVRVSSGTCTSTSNAINLVVNALPDVGYNTTGMTLSYPDTDTDGKALRGGTFGGTVNAILQPSGVGSYSGPGVVGEKFFPNAAGEGDHIITYTYTDPVTGCSKSASIVIKVFSSVDAINNLESIYCDGSGTQPSSPISLTPNTATVFLNSVTLYRYTWGSSGFTVHTANFNRKVPLEYTITGIGIIGSPGSYQINTNSLSLDVNYNIAVSVKYVCVSGDCAAFGISSGGEYSYTKYERTKRKSNPNVDFSGFASGQDFCANVTNIQLSATNTLPSSFVQTLPYSQGEYLISRNPITGFSVAPNAVVNATTKVFNPSAIPGTTISGIPVPNPITSTQVFYLKFRYTDSDGCVDESPVKQFKLQPIPVPAFSGVSSNYCENNAILNPVPSFNITDELFDPNNGYFYVRDNTSAVVRIFGFGVTTLNLDSPSPLPAADNYTLHYVYYTDKGCSAESTPFTFNIKPEPIVDFTGLGTEYCRNEPNVNLTAIVNGTPNSGGTFRIRRVSPSPTSFELLYGDRTFRPTQPLPSETSAVPGLYEVEYSYSQSFPGPISCSNSITKTVTLHDLPNPNFSFPAENQTGTSTGAICRDQNSITLIPTVNGSSPPVPTNGKFRITRTLPTPQPSFNLADGLNVIDFGSTQFSIPTSTNDVYVYDIEYIYRDNNNCENVSAIKTLTVNPSPTLTPANIQITNRCLGDITQFIVSSPTPITTYRWEGTEIPTTTLTTNTFSFQYASIGTKNVILTVTNAQGCQQTIPFSIEIKSKPNPDFIFLGQCLGSPTQFADQTTVSTGGDPISSYFWDFGDGNTSTLQNPTHTYAMPGNYNVSLTVQTNANPDLSCPMTISKNITIFSQFSPTTSTPYIENFNSNNGGWITGQTTAVSSSWQWTNSVISGGKISGIDGNCWRTFRGAGDLVQYNNSEQSFIESPCFDISNLDRPAINFDYWVHTRPGQDGVAVLYSINDGVTWIPLGNVNQGVEWYNNGGITGLPGSGSPGLPNGTVRGWSGDEQTGWKTARFSLDPIKAAAGAGGKVRFRIVFGGLNFPLDNTERYDGFAVDNIKIGSRNRKILLEHFTNAGAPDVAAEDSFINNIAATQEESIDIRYHTNFPNENDPFNKDNVADPSARALFYGISQVPRTTRDGEAFSNPYSIVDPVLTEYQKRSLKPSPFEISVTFGNNPPELLNVGATIKAVEDFNRPVLVRIAVIEKEIDGSVVGLPGNTFYNVVKRMLPDAAGTRINLNWIKDVTQTTVNQSYNPTNFYDKNKMAVVVFVQDEQTGEIHQTFYAEPSVIPAGITAIDEEFAAQIRLYPNPAKDNVFLENKGIGTLYYEIYDSVGKLVGQGSTEETTHEISTKEFSSGLYVLRLRNAKGQAGFKKIIIQR